MTSLPDALATLVAWRDRLSEVCGLLTPLMANGSTLPMLEVEAAELPARRLKALPAPKRRKSGRAKKAAKTPTKAANAGTPRTLPETIAKIQAMDAQGKTFKEICAATGVSEPTARKYANAKPVKPAEPARIDPKTGRPWI